jgi:ribosomal protein L37AE/L43A
MAYKNYCEHADKTYGNGLWQCVACGEQGIDPHCPDCGTERTFIRRLYQQGGYWECPICDEHLIDPNEAQAIITDWKGNRIKGKE